MSGTDSAYGASTGKDKKSFGSASLAGGEVASLRGYALAMRCPVLTYQVVLCTVALAMRCPVPRACSTAGTRYTHGRIRC
eukprot:3549903-Rhodomonas_salina.1